jgi:hypothetical protein
MRSQTDDSAKAGLTSVLATREVIRVSPKPVCVRGSGDLGYGDRNWGLRDQDRDGLWVDC